MAKTKSIPADKVSILIKDLEKALYFVESEREPWVSVGYTKSTFQRLIKQLEGKFPII